MVSVGRGRKFDQRDVSAAGSDQTTVPGCFCPHFLQQNYQSTFIRQNLSKTYHKTISYHIILQTAPSSASGCGRCCRPRREQARVQGWPRHLGQAQPASQLESLLPPSNGPSSVEKTFVQHSLPSSGTSSLSRPATVMLF